MPRDARSRSLYSTVLLGALGLCLATLAQAAPVDRSDLNGDGVVDTGDLAVFATTYLEQDWQAVDWCAFYESSLSNERYFRRLTSDSTANYAELFGFIAEAYGCGALFQQAATTEKSDLNGDGLVDLADLQLFSTNYLNRDWQSVDWCAFHAATLAGLDFEGSATKYYLQHFGTLLTFIDQYFYCNGEPPPPPALLLENAPRYLSRITGGPADGGLYYVSDPLVGSVFIYDADRAPKFEIKALNKPLGVALDSLGRLLVGNDGRDNIEAYDPSTGELVAVFGAGLVIMPTAITVDTLGTIYVTDSLGHRVQVFDPGYTLVRTIGRYGEGSTELEFPTDTAVDVATQRVFVADQGNNRVQVYDPAGNWVTSIAYKGKCGMMGCTSPPFTRIQALDLDAQGRLHVVDNFVATVMMFNPDTRTYLGAYGAYGTGAGTLRVPQDVLVLDAGNAIVLPGDNGRIEVLPVQ